jgi:hypothetical protein
MSLPWDRLLRHSALERTENITSFLETYDHQYGKRDEF